MTETVRTAEMQQTELRFELDSDLTLEELQKLEAKYKNGLVVYPPPAVKGPMLTFAIVVGAVSFAVLVIEHVMEVYKGGTIVNLNKKPPNVSRSKDLPRGVILVLVKDGEYKIETPDVPKSTLEEILAGILKLGAEAGEEGVTKKDVEDAVDGAGSGEKDGGKKTVVPA